MSMLDQKLNRRKFLVSTSAATAAVCVGASLHGCGGGGGGNTQPAGRYDTGLTAQDLAVGDARSPANASYIIARDADGYYAYTNVCTHEGCTVPTPTGGASQCPCHGARFDSNGNNLNGPNNGTRIADLVHYQVSFVGTGSTAAIWVDTSIVVTDRAARVQAPASA